MLLFSLIAVILVCPINAFATEESTINYEDFLQDKITDWITDGDFCSATDEITVVELESVTIPY